MTRAKYNQIKERFNERVSFFFLFFLLICCPLQTTDTSSVLGSRAEASPLANPSSFFPSSVFGFVVVVVVVVVILTLSCAVDAAAN